MTCNDRFGGGEITVSVCEKKADVVEERSHTYNIHGDDERVRSKLDRSRSSMLYIWMFVCVSPLSHECVASG